MEAGPPESRIDARSVRFELAAWAVVLLGGFVFGKIWVIPALAVVIAVGLGFGPKADAFNRIFQIVLAERTKPPAATEPATESATGVRLSQLFAVATLSVATVFYALHLNPLAWLVALAEAGICALHASTGVSMEAAVFDRLRGRKSR